LSQGGDYQAHHVIIRRRGRSHRSCCSCGWMGRSWNELRPAEADAWEHVFGSDCVIDLDTIGGADEDWMQSSWAKRDELVTAMARTSVSPVKVADLIRHARAVASGPSPYSQHARDEIWHLAAQDSTAIRDAISEVDELLERHSRRNASTADAEWLELITTKRLLVDSLRDPL
jgi:hypothetical protein